MNGQESAEAIVPEQTCMNWEGLNVKMSFNFARFVSKVKKADNPERERDYPHEVGVELRGNEGEQSFAPVSAEDKDNSKVNTGNLLEEVLDRNNLNLAYKRV